MTSLAEPTALSQLRADYADRVVGPDDGSYDAARLVFPGGIDIRPAAIVRPRDAGEVARIVTLARDSGTPLAVRCGGHSPGGLGLVENGIVLDLRDMRGIEIDPEARTAWAQTGLTAGEYTNAVGEHGLATGFGDAATVGIGGITLGGGVGFLSRLHGLTVDSLVAAEIVTADGEVREVDAEREPDLFWAIRGGGGNFGVATRFKFRLQAVDRVVGGMLMQPATPEVLGTFLAEADAAPETLTVITNVMPAPPMPFVPEERHGELVVMALVCFAGAEEDADRVLAPFRSVAEPIVDMVRPIPYPEIYGPEPEGYHPTVAFRNLFTDRVDAAQAIERLESADAPMRVAAVPGARRSDRSSAGRRDGLRAPRRLDHGQPGRVLRGPGRGAGAGGLGGRARARAAYQRCGLRQLPRRGGEREGPGRLPRAHLRPARASQGAVRPREPVSQQPEHPARAALGSEVDRARRGGSGALHPQSALAGLNAHPRIRGLRGQYVAGGADGQVPRDERP